MHRPTHASSTSFTNKFNHHPATFWLRANRDIPYSWASSMPRTSCFVSDVTFLVFHEDTMYWAKYFTVGLHVIDLDGIKMSEARAHIYDMFLSWHRDIYCNVMWGTLLITTSLKLPFSNWYWFLCTSVNQHRSPMTIKLSNAMISCEILPAISNDFVWPVNNRLIND